MTIQTKDLQKYSLQWLSDYRLPLFGVATVSILFLHGFQRALEGMKIGAMVYPGWFMTISRLYDRFIGSTGVEIFVLLSGIGLYYSMKKNSAVLPFYRRRAVRLFKPYLLLGVVYWAARTYLEAAFWGKPFHPLNFLLNLSSVSFWLQGERALWYVGFIAAMYLIYPLVFRLYERRFALWFPVLTVLSFALVFAIYRFAPEYYAGCEIGLWRIPAFMIGAGLGVLLYRGVKLPWWSVCLGLAAIFALKLLQVMKPSFLSAVDNDMLSRFLNVFLGLAYLLIFSAVLHVLQWAKLHAFFAWFGKISLEVYLTHVMMGTLFSLLRENATTNIFIYLLAVTIAIPVSCQVSRVANRSKKPKPTEKAAPAA